MNRQALKFKVGDQAIVCDEAVGTVVEAHEDDSVPYLVQFENGNRFWYLSHELSPVTKDRTWN